MLACWGFCSVRPLAPSRRQPPSLLLWLQHSISLSAFEFQSKPEADCKQMDGVIKIPQAGSKEAHSCKRGSSGRTHSCTHAGFLPLWAPPCSPLQIHPTCLLRLHLSEFCPAFRPSTNPRFRRQPSVTSSSRPYTSPPTQPPDCSTFALLGY